MYQIVHGIAGIAIGSQTGNPWLAFIFGLIGHFLLDAIPHESIEIRNWQDNGGNFIKKVALEATIDLILLLTLLFLLWQSGWIVFSVSVITGIIGSVLPDYIWGVGELLKIRSKWLEKYKEFHDWAHSMICKKKYLSTKYAFAIQAIVLIILINIIK